MVIKAAFNVHTIRPKVPKDQNGVVLELLDSKDNEVCIFIPAKLFEPLKETLERAAAVIEARNSPTRH